MHHDLRMSSRPDNAKRACIHGRLTCAAEICERRMESDGGSFGPRLAEHPKLKAAKVDLLFRRRDLPCTSKRAGLSAIILSLDII